MEDYARATEEMLVKTSTRTAPWSLVEGNDKYWARTQVLSKLVAILSKELQYAPPIPEKIPAEESPALRRGCGHGRFRPSASGATLSNPAACSRVRGVSNRRHVDQLPLT